jgi:SNF2 family DNA or RNA helicase
MVFCYYRQEINMMKQMLEVNGFSVIVYDGRSNKKTIDGKCEVLLINIVCGCDGLNLQEYSELYFTSFHWNPFVELQAIARAHRIGQTQPVDVYKYKMTDFDDFHYTIESIIIERQCEKKQIADTYFGHM